MSLLGFCFRKSPQDIHVKLSVCIPRCENAIWSAAMVADAVCTAHLCILAQSKEDQMQPLPLATDQTQVLPNGKQTVSLPLSLLFNQV